MSTNGNSEAGSAVVEVGLDDSDVGQKWEKSADDDSGFFTLKNMNSGLFLTMKTANTLTIEAMMNEKPNIPKLPINTTNPVNEKNGESVQ